MNDSLARLRSQLGDRVVLPGAPDYDEVRRIWNAMHDRRPALIARCLSAEDVASALRYATAADKKVTVRGGGHNVAGAALADDAVLIDLSLMREVIVDTAAGLAYAQGGCLLRDVDAATTPHGLACPAGVVSHTGLGGLALGGGYGWLARKWGLTCDHIVAAEVVLTDGSIVQTDAQTHPDLFWALKGGGGGFGVVTRFALRLRPVGQVHLHAGVYALDNAGEALAAYRDFAEKQQADLHTVGALKQAGAQDWIPQSLHGRPVLVLTAGWFGAPAEGPAATKPLFDATVPAATRRQLLTYAQLQALADHSEPHGNRYYTKSCYLADLTGRPIEEFLGAARDIRSSRSCIDFEYLRGAIDDVMDEDSAFPGRAAPYIYTASAQWTDIRDDGENVDWARHSVERLAAWRYGGAYVNYVQDEPEGKFLEVFGESRYWRLAAVKQRYDPHNVLRHRP
ncbi:FAD-binding oxidoreductase [Kibdelosporangium aridum]|uniref:FAD-binding oxidoreductase n=1 Tax=Kibdelosporangium aridum TaxID=2030 RepID=UPI0035E7C754